MSFCFFSDQCCENKLLLSRRCIVYARISCVRLITVRQLFRNSVQNRLPRGWGECFIDLFPHCVLVNTVNVKSCNSSIASYIYPQASQSRFALPLVEKYQIQRPNSVPPRRDGMQPPGSMSTAQGGKVQNA